MPLARSALAKILRTVGLQEQGHVKGLFWEDDNMKKDGCLCSKVSRKTRYAENLINMAWRFDLSYKELWHVFTS